MSIVKKNGYVNNSALGETFFKKKNEMLCSGHDYYTREPNGSYSYLLYFCARLDQLRSQHRLREGIESLHFYLKSCWQLMAIKGGIITLLWGHSQW